MGAAPTDVARHGVDDLLIGGLRRLLEERRGLHDLAGLAVAALRNVSGFPGTLDRVSAIRAEALDGDDLVPGRIGERGDARAHGVAVHMHRARATRSDATAELGPGHSEDVAYRPKQWHLWICQDVALNAIDVNLRHDTSLRDQSTAAVTVTASLWKGLPACCAGY